MFRIASKKIAIGLTLLAGALLVASSLGCGDTTAFPPASYTHPYSTVTWSADGSQIVFSRNVEGTYVVDAGGTHLHTIPVNAPIGGDANPGSVAASLSPDGSQVVYVALFSDGFLGALNAEIMTASIDGTDVSRLTQNVDYDDTSPAWSPDSSRIAYISNGKLTVMAADGGGRSDTCVVGRISGISAGVVA